MFFAIRNERILQNRNAVASYALLLKNNFPDAPEIQLLRESEKE